MVPFWFFLQITAAYKAKKQQLLGSTEAEAQKALEALEVSTLL
jgi:hypothetical protein